MSHLSYPPASTWLNGRVDVGYLRQVDATWDDLRFPAGGLNPVGSISDPDIDTDDGLPVFSKNLIEIISGFAQMPHKWKLDDLLSPHVHWGPMTTGLGNVVWRLFYKISAVNGAFPAGWTTEDITVAAGGVIEKYQVDGFSDINMSAIGSVTPGIKWKLARVGNDTEDTYDDDAKVFEFDFHYRIDSLGSNEEYSKVD